MEWIQAIREMSNESGTVYYFEIESAQFSSGKENHKDLNVRTLGRELNQNESLHAHAA
jgi:hypothetical protein